MGNPKGCRGEGSGTGIREGENGYRNGHQGDDTEGHRLGKSGQRIPMEQVKKVDLGILVLPRGESVVDIMILSRMVGTILLCSLLYCIYYY